MLEYEWGNPSPIMLSGDDPNIPNTHDQQDHNRHINILDPYAAATAHHSFNDNHHHHHHLIPQQQPTTTSFFHHPQQHQVSSLYDPRASHSAAAAYSYATSTPHHPSFLSLDGNPAASAAPGYFLIPKTEEVSRPSDFNARIGLNLGGRTYFSSAEDDFVNRLYRRSRPIEPGSSNAPRCQAEGCNADLTHAKHYHRRHKVCEFHSKASTVIAAGLTQRFCQQCSRFHLLSEFDNGKRSCRKRLADHNRRRRKSHQNNQENQKSMLPETAPNSSSENPTRSPPDSTAPSSSSVTVAISPPRMSLDTFKQRPPFQPTASSSSASSSSLFFSSG
ncbi:Squamosa promoter-binding-like protein 8 [Turnera subulata]|uniref:Squamosa promoter-binding-like protein 8 n=1 Tax=Turnera subulata TaxID=218843 RepID=A0A9Q0FA10_9ROSI|nr:Squamosa promoter-binding-like protein 8 [Turnera subulata]